MPAPTRLDLWRVALRTPLLQATWNYERQQGLGWAWCLEPILKRLYPDDARRRERLAAHTAYFNTQPTMVSLALGAVAGLEEHHANGDGADAAAIERAKGVLGSALAALGDRLFWGTLRPLAACVGVLVALNGSWLGAVWLWLLYNVVHLSLRFSGVHWGYRRGPAVLEPVVRQRFETAIRWLGIVGAGLVGMVVAALLVPHGAPRGMSFQAALVAGLGLGLATALKPRPSPTEWALGFGALCVVAAWIR